MKIFCALLSVFVCVASSIQAATAAANASVAVDEKQRISFYLPRPNQQEDTQFEVGDKRVPAVLLGSGQGQSAFFITFYRSPVNEPETAIEQELVRCLANVDGQVIARQKLSGVAYPALEVVVKSPQNKVLTMRCRIFYAAQRIFALTAVTTDGATKEAFAEVEQFFAAFKIETTNP